MAKFGRRYELRVEGQQLGIHTLTYPLTCKFDIERKNFSMANSATFSIYGLSLSSRKDIYYDSDFKKKLIPISFWAGYASESNIPLIFSGNVRLAYTVREGPELITKIEALDGGFGLDDSTISETISPPWNFVKTMKYLMEHLAGVKPGVILVGPKSNPSKEPPDGTSKLVLNGKVWEVLLKYTPSNGTLFIDNGVVNMLGENVTMPSPGILPTISSDTGLLNIPIKSGYNVTAQCLFEPTFNIGQIVKLDSALAPWVNDMYKIVGIHHSGTISGAESGDASTTLGLLSTKAGT